MAESDRERRESRRFPLSRKKKGALIDGDIRIDVLMVDMSSGGFGVFAEHRHTIEAGKTFVFETGNGLHNVTIAHARETDDGISVGLRRLSDIYDESAVERRKPRRRTKFFRVTPGSDGVMTAGLAIAVAVVVGIALLSSSWRTMSLAGPGNQPDVQAKDHAVQRKGAKPLKSKPRRQKSSPTQETIASFAEKLAADTLTVLGVEPEQPGQ